MRNCVATSVLLFVAAPALAELQSVTVGGRLSLSFEHYENLLENGAAPRVGLPWHLGRPISGGPGIFSGVSFAQDGDYSVVSQRTELWVDAQMSDGVSAFIHLDSVETWGEDFRSNPWSGADGRATSVDDVEVYQAYIQAEGFMGLPLRLRVGRQELVFGSSWLLGNNTGGPIPDGWGLSYDALRLTYTGVEDLMVDAFWGKLAEGMAGFADEDVDLYGVYGSYAGFNSLTVDAYWLLVRESISHPSMHASPRLALLERFLGWNDFGTSTLHTVGLRIAGERGGLDYEVEAAFQFGEADVVSAGFDSHLHAADVDFDAWGGTMTLGYSFDVNWSPRLWLSASYYEGDDNRDVSFWEWLNPFHEAEPSISFNRLFADIPHSSLLGAGDMSNLFTYTLGVEAAPTDAIGLYAMLSHYIVDEPYRRSLVPVFTFIDAENDDDLGWEFEVGASYDYSEDLAFGASYARFFTGEGAEQGSFVSLNGLDFLGGRDDEDLQFFYAWVELEF